MIDPPLDYDGYKLIVLCYFKQLLFVFLSVLIELIVLVFGEDRIGLFDNDFMCQYDGEL